MGSNAEGRFPSPAPSAPQAIDTDMSSDCSDLSGSSRNLLPTLIEATFRPQALHCYSFTALIQNNYNERVSFAQLARLIQSTDNVERINDFTIKPMKQNSFLVTSFSRRITSQLSSGRITVSNAAKAKPYPQRCDEYPTPSQQNRGCQGSGIANETSRSATITLVF